jgi:DNA-binding response OmpR family regulator
MLTALGTLQDRLDGFDCSADDYLPKLFAFDEPIWRS